MTFNHMHITSLISVELELRATCLCVLITIFSFRLTQEFVDPVQNFSCYRQSLEKCIHQAGSGKEERQWVVPFFSLILKDIYFLHEGMSDR